MAIEEDPVTHIPPQPRPTCLQISVGPRIICDAGVPPRQTKQTLGFSFSQPLQEVFPMIHKKKEVFPINHFFSGGHSLGFGTLGE